MEARGIVLNREIERERQRGETERRDRERGKGRKERGGITGMSGGCSAVRRNQRQCDVRYCAVASY